MRCNKSNKNCGCQFNLKTTGICDVTRIKIDGKNRKNLNWNEISVPEIMTVPPQKPEIEHLNQMFVTVNNINSKLIETPFSYNIFDRQATAFEITTVTNAINFAGIIDIAPIVTAINALLAIPNLPAIPAVAAVKAALTAVTTASVNLDTAIADVLEILRGPCLVSSVLIDLVKIVQAALNVLQTTLLALTAAINGLAAATAGIPIVGPLVQEAVKAVVALIDTVIAQITAALNALLDSITLIGETKVVVIQPNEEGTCLSGRKLIVEGILEQKAVYTGLVSSQSVHSVENCVPFNAYIIPYASFEGLTYQENIEVVEDLDLPCETTTVNGFLYNPNIPLNVDLCEKFNVDVCIEDIFSYPVDSRNIFKNVTLFLFARPEKDCLKK